MSSPIIAELSVPEGVGAKFNGNSEPAVFSTVKLLKTMISMITLKPTLVSCYKLANLRYALNTYTREKQLVNA